MQNPADLCAALVTKLRAIAALVAALDNDATNIFAYEDNFPASNDIGKAIQDMPRGSIMVAWRGTANAGRNWEHRFSLYLKAPGKYTTLWNLISNGVPTGGDGLGFRYTMIHTSCYPIHGRISAEPRTLAVSDLSYLDYYECPLTLQERGAAT